MRNVKRLYTRRARALRRAAEEYISRILNGSFK